MADHHRRRSLGIVVLAFATLVLGAGCGTDNAERTADVRASDESVEQTEPEGTNVAAAISAAAERSAAQPTVQVSMRITADGELVNDATTQMSADGEVGRGTVELPGVGQVPTLVTSDAYYYQFPGLPPGVEWVRMSFDEVRTTTGLDVDAMKRQDPRTAFAGLSSISDDVEEIGREDRGGAATTHYRFSTDAQALFDNAVDSGVLTGPGVEAGSVFEGETDLDVWIDDAGLVRAMSYELELSADAGAGLPDAFGYEFEFAEYGEPVEVTPPSPEVTISLQEMAALGG